MLEPASAYASGGCPYFHGGKDHKPDGPDSVETTPMIIGGQPREAADGGTIDVTNPATGEPIGRIPHATAGDVADAVAAAGPDPASAVMYAVLLEKACRIQLMAAAAGGRSIWSSEEEVDAKRRTASQPFEKTYRYLMDKGARMHAAQLPADQAQSALTAQHQEARQSAIPRTPDLAPR